MGKTKHIGDEEIALQTPRESIKYCLQESGVRLQDVKHIAINRDPKANFLKKSLYAFSKRPSLKLVSNRLKNASKKSNTVSQ